MAAWRLRVLQENLIEDEEGCLLPVLRTRLSAARQWEILRWLLINQDAAPEDTMTRPRASRALGDCALDSRAEILLGYSLPFCDRVLQLSGKRNPTVRDFMHYTGRGRLENPGSAA